MILLCILFFLAVVQIYVHWFASQRRRGGKKRFVGTAVLWLIVFLIPSWSLPPDSPDTTAQKEAEYPAWLVYYNQTDPRWAEERYGQTDLIKETGCGPTVLAMAVSSLTETEINPKEMADWASEHGYCSPGSGSYHTLIADGLVQFGLTCTPSDDAQTVRQALQDGFPVIVLMGEGHFTGGGHFLLLCDIDEAQTVFVDDPKSTVNTEKRWAFDLIAGEAKTSPTTGGAYWIIEKQV